MFLLDRTPDKNTWKWTNNTSTTPEYLERRNQFRRSEMRYRSSKKQRKPLTTSVSLEGFHSPNPTIQLRKLSGLASADGLSVDDSALLTRTNFKATCDHRGTHCQCDSVKMELTTALAAKNSTASIFSEQDMFGSKASVADTSDIDSKAATNIPVGRKKADYSTAIPTEIKMYNTKLLPKRIANIKKQRAKTAAKETFKFYMDFPATEEPTTVLRITESTENIAVEDLTEQPEGFGDNCQGATSCNQTPAIHETNDVAIISDLLKEKHLEFERILSKPPKKKSIDNSKISLEVEGIFKPEIEESLKIETCESNTNPDEHTGAQTYEPIYESLLRNVHVPYKFSPILSRSISQQHYRFPKPEALSEEPQGPDSDYVTLEYTDSGELKSVDGVPVKFKDKLIDMSRIRNSDSNINYDTSTKQDDLMADNKSSSRDVLNRQGSFCLMSSSTCSSFESNAVFGQSNHSLPHLNFRKSLDCSSRKKDGLLAVRRVSDVTDMRSKRIIHKQGSESLGSRIAHLDYADPRTLFPSASHKNILINRKSIQRIKDHVPASNASTEHIFDLRNKTGFTIGDSFYEQSVEDLLEDPELQNASRDSFGNANMSETTNELSEPKTPTKPVIPTKPMHLPPALPVKCSNKQRPTSLAAANLVTSTLNPSWVLKQIRNFEN